MDKIPKGQYLKGKELESYFEKRSKEKSIEVKPSKVATFLQENPRLVFLDSVRKSIHCKKPKDYVFYEAFLSIVPAKQRYNLSQVGYCNDYVLTEEYAYRIMQAFNKIGYIYSDTGWIYFDVLDYKDYVKNEVGYMDVKRMKWNIYRRNNIVKHQYYSKPFLSSNEDTTSNVQISIEEYQKENIERNNECELMMKEVLDSIGVEYEHQKVIYTGRNFYIADFYIPQNNVIIEVDGGIHKNYEALLRDRNRDAEFSRRGILTIRFDATDPFFCSEAHLCLPKILGK